MWLTVVPRSGLMKILDRIDKYYMLVRKFVNGSFRLLAREMWTADAMDEYTKIISGARGPL